jgi:hypothetical protein
MKMEETGCSETLAYKIQMPGNYTEESIQHSERGKSSKSRSLSSTEVEFLNLCKLGTNAPTFLGIMPKNNDILLELMQ